MKTKQSTREEYQKRINIVLEYINNRLDEDLDLNKLAAISNFSPYHFHRIISGSLGEPLKAYITRLRVETAAKLLRYTDLSIENIAYNVGYEMPSSLSKAFRSFYDITPGEYRADKNYTIMRPVLLHPDLKLRSPKIVERETEKAIYIRLLGNYADLDYPGTWQRLWQYVKDEKLYSAGIEHIGMYHDDPKVTEIDKLRTDICLTIKRPAKAKGEIGVKEIAGDKYAVFTYEGPYDNLGIVYDTIFTVWLPESGFELRNIPMFEKYMNDPSKTNPEKLRTEIHIPIE